MQNSLLYLIESLHAGSSPALTAMTIYNIVKQVGLGTVESPIIDYPTAYYYFDNQEAIYMADKLWKSKVSEKERLSPMCFIHYTVNEITVL